MHPDGRALPPGAVVADGTLRADGTPLQTVPTGLASLRSQAQRFPTDTENVGNAMFDRAATDINETFDQQARGLNENAFARGIGAGTIVPYYRGRLEEGRGKAIGQARQTATIGAGAEARANQETSRRLF